MGSPIAVMIITTRIISALREGWGIPSQIMVWEIFDDSSKGVRMRKDPPMG
jgi:hypothetical protein